jgi:hypothetical protein
LNISSNQFTSEDAEHFFDVIGAMADELLDRYAHIVLWHLRLLDFQGLTGDYYRWPYAGDPSKFSFLDEAVWVYHQKGFEQFEMAFDAVINQVTQKVAKTMTDVEMDLLNASVVDQSELTYPDQLRRVIQAINRKTASYLSDRDREGIEAGWSEYRLPFEEKIQDDVE